MDKKVVQQGGYEIDKKICLLSTVWVEVNSSLCLAVLLFCQFKSE